LISVLWIAGLLAAVAGAFAMAVQLHVKSEANLVGSMQAELAADGMVRLIAYRLASASFAEHAGESSIDGKLAQCALGENSRAFISVQDQGGLVDLNRASLNTLGWIISNVTVQAGDNLSLAEAIADFRDSDIVHFGVVSSGGEESLVPGSPGMKNAPFQSVDEIEQVIPSRMADLAKLKRVLTVYSHEDGIDPDSAPAELNELIELNRNKGALPFAPSQHKTFAVDAEVTVADGSKFRRMAMVSLTREPQRPFVILEWRQMPGSLVVPGTLGMADRRCGQIAIE
jgi:general secretion pathway protein K